MRSEPNWLTADQLVEVNQKVVASTGEPHGVLKPHELSSAPFRPRALWQYENEDDLAAMLSCGLSLVHLKAFALVALIAPFSLASSVSLAAPLSSNAYSSRDGEAEALADLAAGKGAKLYSHEENVRVPGFSTPGLFYCEPRMWDKHLDANLFLPLPEANWMEGYAYSPEQRQLAAAARDFASAYNRTMFRLRKSEIVRICPKAQLAD